MRKQTSMACANKNITIMFFNNLTISFDPSTFSFLHLISIFLPPARRVTHLLSLSELKIETEYFYLTK